MDSKSDLSSWLGEKLRPKSWVQKNEGASPMDPATASALGAVELATPDDNCPNDQGAFTRVAQIMATKNDAQTVLAMISGRMSMPSFKIYLKSLQLVDFLLHTHRGKSHVGGHWDSYFQTNMWVRKNFLDGEMGQPYFHNQEESELVQRQISKLLSLIQNVNILDGENDDPKMAWMTRVLRIPIPHIRLAPSPAYYPQYYSNTTMDAETSRNPIRLAPSPTYYPDGAYADANGTYPNSANYQNTQEPIKLSPFPPYDIQNPNELYSYPTWYPNVPAWQILGNTIPSQGDMAQQNIEESPRNETSLPPKIDMYGSQTPDRASTLLMYNQNTPGDIMQPLSKETVLNGAVDRHGPTDSFGATPAVDTPQRGLETFTPSIESSLPAKSTRVSGYQTSSWQQWKSLPGSQSKGDHLSAAHSDAQNSAVVDSRLNFEDTTCYFRARVLFSYSEKSKGHLELFQGEVITVTAMPYPHWWVGSNHKGEEGMFPRNFVETLKGGEEAIDIGDAVADEFAPLNQMGGDNKSPRVGHAHASASRSAEQLAPPDSSHLPIRDTEVQAPIERIEDLLHTLPSLHSIEEMTHRLERDEFHSVTQRSKILQPNKESQPRPPVSQQEISLTAPSLVSRSSRLSSDLVRDSKLETFLSNSGAVVRHISYDSNPQMRRQRVRKEETWRRCKELGTGAFGCVWLQERLDGDETEVGMLRAVKEIVKSPPQEMGKEIDYDRELEAIAKFSHSKYVHCFVKSSGWYESDTMIYITMEYMEKGDLQSHLTRPFPEEEVKDIVFQLLEGLSFMHNNGFAHRDLKPANILVSEPSPNWWVKIGDFGISKRAQEESTVFRTFVGTRGYLAPEVIGIFSIDDMSQQDTHQNSSNSYTVSVDLWALGAIMFKLLTNKDVFENPRKLARYVTAKQPFPAELVSGSGASEACVSFLEQVMGRSPSERPSSSQALGHRWLSEFQNPPEESLENILESLSMTPTVGVERQSGFSTVDTMASAQWPTEYR